MDDEIEIEEHDILEHPQVKAVFADLSKIEIQVHTGAFDVSPPHNEEESSNLLEERPDYIENVFTDENHLDCDEEFLDDNSDKRLDDLNEQNDSDNNDDTKMSIRHLTNDINETVNRLVDVVHEISDDEAAPAVDKIKDEIEPRKCYVVDSETPNADSEKVVEISDDEAQNNNDDIIKNSINKIKAAGNIEVNQSNGATQNKFVYAERNENSNDQEVCDTDVSMVERDDAIEDMVANNKELETRETMIDAPNGLFEDDTNPLKRIREILEMNAHESNQESMSMVVDQNVNDDMVAEENIRHEIDREENKKSMVDGQNKASEMETEISNNTDLYPNGPIKQELVDFPIKEELDDFDADFNFDESASAMEVNFDENPSNTFEEEIYFPNKIILGTKPSPTIVSYDKDKSYLDVVVCLEDWGKRLESSQTYCGNCKILFPTPSALDYHNMTAHSLLAPIINRAVKSTAKNSIPVSKNIAKKSTSSIDIAKSTHCSHCNVNFKDNTDLIKHLYELLPQQYSCNICNKTFSSQSDLASHSAVHVKTEPRKIIKAKKNLEQNPMLRNLLTQEAKTIPIKAKKVIKTTPVKVKEEPVEYDSGFRYKCLICNDVLYTYASARYHRRLHPERKSLKLFNKIITISKVQRTKDKLVFEDEKPKLMTKTKDAKGVEKAVEMIPKSALFQCPKCSLHFTSSTAGISHMTGNNCDTKIPLWSCPTCKKKLRVKDKNLHKKQHQLSKKLKIYKITKTSNDRTLCKCLRCNVHFEYILLKMHIKKCGKIATAKCHLCNILVGRNRLPNHMFKHDFLKMKPKDFNFVEYVLANNMDKENYSKKNPAKADVDINKTLIIKTYSKKNPVKADVDIKKPLIIKTKPGELKQTFLKVDNDKVTEKQSKATENVESGKSLKLLYCKHCKLSMSFLLKQKFHLSKACLTGKPSMFCCHKCGLYITYKSRETHARLHNLRNLTLKDMQFYDIVTKKRIPVPMIKYPSCATCKIIFLTKNLRRRHICGEDYENCEYCGDRYEISTLKIHREFHKAQKSHEKVGLEKSMVESESVIPELMMRYESLNPIWNILFMCGNCELVTDLYNKAVTHSQAHLSKQYKQPKSVNCKTCKLDLDETCYDKHKEHHTQTSIKRKAFKLLTYSPENLLEESWFQMFETLPEKLIRQIIDQSVFGGERSLKMKLVKYGLPEFTLYCCSNCLVCFDTNNLRAHVEAKCMGSKSRCSVCEIAFESDTSLTFHLLLHEKGIKREEFRIIHFIKTKTGIEPVSPKIQEAAPTRSKTKVDPNALSILMELKDRVANTVIDFEEPTIINPRAKFRLYRCVHCSICIHYKPSMLKHSCSPPHLLYHCKICKQNFSCKSKSFHESKHAKLSYFKATNINIYEFDAEFERSKKQRRKTYKKPGLVVKKTKVNIKVKAKKVGSKAKVKRTSSVESFESTLDDTSKDRSYVETKPNLTHSYTDITEYRKSSKVLRCNCGLHYTSLKTLKSHSKTCSSDQEISSENCNTCGLLFPKDIIASHMCKRSLINLEDCETSKSYDTRAKKAPSKADIGIDEENSIETDSLEKQRNNKKVHIKFYKCGVCQVHYLNQNTCYKHTYKNHVQLDPKQYIDCKICGLTFMLSTLQLHIRRHHKTNLDLEKVLIEEYHPGVGKQALKIDIYYASQKVQNVQVSSSND